MNKFLLPAMLSACTLLAAPAYAADAAAGKARKVLKHIEPERVTLTTDCGLKQLPRTCAREKLRALADGAAIVRRELGKD